MARYELEDGALDWVVGATGANTCVGELDAFEGEIVALGSFHEALRLSGGVSTWPRACSDVQTPIG